MGAPQVFEGVKKAHLMVSPRSLLHDAIDQAIGHGLLRAEEVVAVEVQGHLLARLAAQLRVR